MWARVGGERTTRGFSDTRRHPSAATVEGLKRLKNASIFALVPSRSKSRAVLGGWVVFWSAQMRARARSVRSPIPQAARLKKLGTPGRSLNSAAKRLFCLSNARAMRARTRHGTRRHALLVLLGSA